MSVEFLASPPVLILTVITILLLLYLARKPAHRGITAFFKVISSAMRLSARSVLQAEKNLQQRNREVLLAEGMLQSERELEREFQRVESIVNRDLQSYPGFHRQLSELLERIDNDYRTSAELPPSPPEWLNAVEAVAGIPDPSGKGVAAILGEINNSLDRHHKNAMEEYRKASGVRHSLLKRMQPAWRQLTKTLEKVNRSITSLKDRATLIDGRMQQYEQVLGQTDTAEQRLASSAMTQFLIAGLVMLIAIAGAIINFNLIALPMSEMVGGSSYIGNFKTSDVAALVIILVESSMGLFLMESLRITRLFPLISTMEDRMRVRMAWIAFGILSILAAVESALAFMRDRIAADMEALRQSLAGADAIVAQHSLIPTVGQMVLGFILPFALAFVAIPLESFVHSSRTVFGRLAAWLLRIIAWVLRLTGNIARRIGQLLVACYDLPVFPFLWLEERILAARQQTAEDIPVPATKKTKGKTS